MCLKAKGVLLLTYYFEFGVALAIWGRYQAFHTTCIIHKNANIELYCHNYYSKETFMLAYNEFIHPILDISMGEFKCQD